MNLRTVKLLMILSNFIVIQCIAQDISLYIHLDQFGYITQSEKVAVISNPQVGYNATDSYQVGNSLEVRDATTDDIMYTNSPTSWNNNGVHEQSGDAGWWFDFSEFNVTGSYYIFDPSTNHRSAIFEINDNPYKDVIQVATKTFYYNRCNATKAIPFAQANWTDGMNFLQDARVRDAYDQDNASSERDMSGGWFDAGDYNKYITFAHNPMHQLLTSYEDHPTTFTDNWNIPESNDGLPDILNELQWELDWIYKMVNADGSVYNKVGSLEYDINDAAPPSNNTAPRYYGRTCSSASLSVASINAHAAKVFRQFPDQQAYADVLQSDAVLCWNRFMEFYSTNSLETDCDDQTVKAGDADWDEQTQINNALVAAVYLFELTGEASYSDFIRDNISLAEPFDTEFWSPQHVILLEALLNYANLDNTDQQISNNIYASVELAVSNNWGNYFDFSPDDLYRSYAPDWVYFWGSNMTMANVGNLCNTIAKYNVVPDANRGLVRKAAELLHYFHGVNPQGIVYLSNMYDYGADRSVNEIFHTWFNHDTNWDNALKSLYGPAPGFLPGGPNQGYSGSLSPPANQPVQKAYLDYNDGFRDVAYEITEPAIYYQAAFIQLLSTYVDVPIPTATSNVSANKNQSIVYPNPFTDLVKIKGAKAGNKIDVISIDGKLMQSIVLDNNTAPINLSKLPKGLYILKVFNTTSNLISNHKVIKLE